MLEVQTFINQLNFYLMNVLGIKIALIFFMLNLQTQDTIVGSWEGILDIQGTELPILFHILQEGGEYKSTMDSPAQDAIGIPMDEITYKKGELVITLTQAGIRYVAKLEEGKITGIFYQGGLKLPLVMKYKNE